MLDQPELIQIKIGGETKCFAAAKLLASKAANDPTETKFPVGCEVWSKGFDINESMIKLLIMEQP